MKPQERFTREEIREILAAVATEVDEVDLGDEAEENHHLFLCDYGPIKFSCMMLSTVPFHDQMMLSSYRWTTDNPFELSNQFADDAYLARSIVKLNPDGTLYVDDDGDFEIKAELFVPFTGTVTPEHLQFIVQMWAEDLIAFHGFETDEDDALDSADTSVEIDTTDVSLHDQLMESLSETTGQTARQLARALGITRNDVNRTLYGSPESFVHDSGQPPRWSARS